MQAIPHSGIIQFIASKNYNNEAEMGILDTGCGIPKNNWKKIFDPLFTNKKEGIGIGLSLCQIVNDIMVISRLRKVLQKALAYRLNMVQILLLLFKRIQKIN